MIMSVLVFIETDEGQVKTSSLGAIAYGVSLGKTTVVATGNIAVEHLANLGKYGVSHVLHAADEHLESGVIQATATLVAEAAKKIDADIVVMACSSLVDALASSVGIKLNASVVTNVVDLPDTSDGFILKRSVYTGKAFAYVKITTIKKIITIKKNIMIPQQKDGQATIEVFAPNFVKSDFEVTRKEVSKATGDILLPEADKVVSAGRGLKAPENWGMIEDLAKLLGAATACSKPVSDMDWRPHHEHVGQTGIKIAPNLYIAVGISGAIQHLAGVNSSKVIVVVNKDPDAPFFKAADYGVVGDAFEVIPKLIQALQSV